MNTTLRYLLFIFVAATCQTACACRLSIPKTEQAVVMLSGQFSVCRALVSAADTVISNVIPPTIAVCDTGVSIRTEYRIVAIGTNSQFKYYRIAVPWAGRTMPTGKGIVPPFYVRCANPTEAMQMMKGEKSIPVVKAAGQWKNRDCEVIWPMAGAATQCIQWTETQLNTEETARSDGAHSNAVDELMEWCIRISEANRDAFYNLQDDPSAEQPIIYNGRPWIPQSVFNYRFRMISMEQRPGMTFGWYVQERAYDMMGWPSAKRDRWYLDLLTAAMGTPEFASLDVTGMCAQIAGTYPAESARIRASFKPVTPGDDSVRRICASNACGAAQYRWIGESVMWSNLACYANHTNTIDGAAVEMLAVLEHLGYLAQYVDIQVVDATKLEDEVAAVCKATRNKKSIWDEQWPWQTQIFLVKGKHEFDSERIPFTNDVVRMYAGCRGIGSWVTPCVLKPTDKGWLIIHIGRNILSCDD